MIVFVERNILMKITSIINKKKHDPAGFPLEGLNIRLHAQTSRTLKGECVYMVLFNGLQQKQRNVIHHFYFSKGATVYHLFYGMPSKKMLRKY